MAMISTSLNSFSLKDPKDASGTMTGVKRHGPELAGSCQLPAIRVDERKRCNIIIAHGYVVDDDGENLSWDLE
jgi:hypothetical protein